MPANVQPQDCAATLRVDEWAIGGYGGAPLRPVRAGGTAFFSVTAPPSTAFALAIGFRQEPGVVLPFGLANLVPTSAGILIQGFLGNPAAITDANGEQVVPIAIPPGFGGSIFAQAVIDDPLGAGLLFSNPIGLGFLP